MAQRALYQSEPLSARQDGQLLLQILPPPCPHTYTPGTKRLLHAELQSISPEWFDT